MSAVGYDYVQRSALGYALEHEVWPLFLEWWQENVMTVEGREWLESEPDVAALRMEWLRRSPDEFLRSLAR